MAYLPKSPSSAVQIGLRCLGFCRAGPDLRSTELPLEKQVYDVLVLDTINVPAHRSGKLPSI